MTDLVWDHPTLVGNEKLLMLKIADWSNDEGQLLYPTSPGVLADKLKVTERRLRQMLQAFEERKWIATYHEGLQGGRGVRHQMRIAMNLGSLFPGYVPRKPGTGLPGKGPKPGTGLPSNGAKPGTTLPGLEETRKSSALNPEISSTFPPLSNGVLTKTSLLPQAAEGGEEVPGNPNRPPTAQALSDSIVAALQLDPKGLTSSSKGALGKAVSQLLEVGATPDDVRQRVARWPALFNGATLTPSALAKHWPSLKGDPTGAGVPEELCEHGRRAGFFCAGCADGDQ
jgi:hypothetical protein